MFILWYDKIDLSKSQNPLQDDPKWKHTKYSKTGEKALRETEDFPETMCGFIEVGEETGKLNDMLTTVSLYYEEEFDSSVDNMSSLIEPIMIVFMGIMIGGLMIAMYSPIFNVGALIG